MKKDKFPHDLFVTTDGDSKDGFFPVAWEDIPEQDGDLVAKYALVSIGKIKVEPVIVRMVSLKTK